MYRYRELVTSFLASAMLSSAMLKTSGAVIQAGVVDPSAARKAIESVLLTGGAAGLADAAMPEPTPILVAADAPEPSPKSPLPPEKLQAYVDYALTATKITHAPDPMMAALGLSTPYLIKVASIKMNGKGYGVSVGLVEPRRIFVYVREESAMLIFACDPQGRPLAAARFNFADSVAVPLALDSVRSDFNEILRALNTHTPPPVQSAAASNS